MELWGNQMGQRVLRFYRVFVLPGRPFLSPEFNAAYAKTNGQGSISRRSQSHNGKHLFARLPERADKNFDQITFESAGQAQCHIYLSYRQCNQLPFADAKVR